MNIKQASKLNVLVSGLLLLLAAMALHTFLVYVLVGLGKGQPVTRDDNTLLSLADVITFNNPDVAEAMARYQRNQALLYDGSQGVLTDSQEKKRLLLSSLEHWNKAIGARPVWPYYQLGAYDIEVLSGGSAAAIQQRLGYILEHSPNERGIDRSLVEVSIFAWSKLSPEQKTAVSERLQRISWSDQRRLMGIIGQTGRAKTICHRVNRGFALKWCKQRKLVKAS